MSDWLRWRTVCGRGKSKRAPFRCWFTMSAAAVQPRSALFAICCGKSPLAPRHFEWSLESMEQAHHPSQACSWIDAGGVKNWPPLNPMGSTGFAGARLSGAVRRRIAGAGSRGALAVIRVATGCTGIAGAVRGVAGVGARASGTATTLIPVHVAAACPIGTRVSAAGAGCIATRRRAAARIPSAGASRASGRLGHRRSRKRERERRCCQDLHDHEYCLSGWIVFALR